MKVEVAGGAPAGRHGLAADPDGSVHERSRGEDDRLGGKLHPEEGLDAFGLSVGGQDDPGGHAFADVEVGSLFEDLAHLGCVL